MILTWVYIIILGHSDTNLNVYKTHYTVNPNEFKETSEKHLITIMCIV